MDVQLSNIFRLNRIKMRGQNSLRLMSILGHLKGKGQVWKTTFVFSRDLFQSYVTFFMTTQRFLYTIYVRHVEIVVGPLGNLVIVK